VRFEFGDDVECIDYRFDPICAEITDFVDEDVVRPEEGSIPVSGSDAAAAVFSLPPRSFECRLLRCSRCGLDF
jgi:hypothetical protein